MTVQISEDNAPQVNQTLDLNHFYSAEPIDVWKQIIGEDLHYHFGYFSASEALETGLKQAVRNFYPYIKSGSRILDIGCGWGGPMTLLSQELHCAVEGLTISTSQAQYCRDMGLKVHCQDIEQHEIRHQHFDAILLLEVLSHIRDKAKLLTQLRAVAPRLILTVNCLANNSLSTRETFGNSMMLCTVTELTQHLEAAGWQIQFIQNRRFQSLRTIALWKENLDRIYGTQTPPGQLAILQSLVKSALQSPLKWCQSFPLIDIVAN